MLPCRFLTIFTITAAFGLFVTPLNASTAKLQPAKLSYLPKADSTDVWTQSDINVFCEKRWNNTSDAFKTCVKRNKRKLGHEKNPGDRQELDTFTNESEKPNQK